MPGSQKPTCPGCGLGSRLLAVVNVSFYYWYITFFQIHVKERTKPSSTPLIEWRKSCQKKFNTRRHGHVSWRSEDMFAALCRDLPPCLILCLWTSWLLLPIAIWGVGRHLIILCIRQRKRKGKSRKIAPAPKTPFLKLSEWRKVRPKKSTFTLWRVKSSGIGRSKIVWRWTE